MVSLLGFIKVINDYCEVNTSSLIARNGTTCSRELWFALLPKATSIKVSFS